MTTRPADDRVIVTSAQERFALAACRSLSKAGYGVAAVADVTPAATHWSRFCSERHTLVDAKRDPDAFVDGLAAIVREREYVAILPASDAALVAISRRRELLEPYTRLGLPSHAVVDACTDKIRLQEAAALAGIPAPDAVVCHSATDAGAAASEFGFPIVIKARRTFFELDGRIEQRGSELVHDRARLARLVDRFGVPFLVQRAVSGMVYSAAGVMTAEGLLAFAASRYLRTWPPDGGNVAFGETIVPPVGLENQVTSLLRHLGWEGIFEIELIQNGSGELRTIDVNPRLYGSMALAASAGTPFAVIWCDHLLGRPSTYPSTAQPGMRYRWEDADIRYAFAQLRHGRLRRAGAALAPRRRVVHAYFRLNDPAPMVARAIVLARGRARARLDHG